MLKGLIFIFCIFTSSLLSAQESSIKGFYGEWSGQGQLFENPAEFKMSWKSSLDGKFIELQFENGLVDNGKYQRILSAKAVYWFENESHLKGHWYDTRGYVLPLEATFENNMLITLWGDDKTERGKTVYQLDPDSKSITVTDYVLSGTEYSQFGEAKYSKSN